MNIEKISVVMDAAATLHKAGLFDMEALLTSSIPRRVRIVYEAYDTMRNIFREGKVDDLLGPIVVSAKTSLEMAIGEAWPKT